MASDLCEHVLNTLKTSTHAKAVAIRALLVSGAESIGESGDLTGQGLNDAEAARRLAGVTNKALYLMLQDAGEEVVRAGVSTQTIVARVIDRLSGYSNVRAVRKALVDYFLTVPYRGKLGDGQAVIAVAYLGRSGHQYDRTAGGVEFEAITLRGHIVLPED